MICNTIGQEPKPWIYIYYICMYVYSFKSYIWYLQYCSIYVYMAKAMIGRLDLYNKEENICVYKQGYEWIRKTAKAVVLLFISWGPPPQSPYRDKPLLSKKREFMCKAMWSCANDPYIPVPWQTISSIIGPTLLFHCQTFCHFPPPKIRPN